MKNVEMNQRMKLLKFNLNIIRIYFLEKFRSTLLINKEACKIIFLSNYWTMNWNLILQITSELIHKNTLSNELCKLIRMSIANLNLENIALKYSREKEKINNFHNF